MCVCESFFGGEFKLGEFDEADGEFDEADGEFDEGDGDLGDEFDEADGEFDDLFPK